MARAALFIIFLVLQLLHWGSSRSVKDSNLLISDGLEHKLISQSSSLLQVVDDLKADTVTCEPIYGFLPCATSFWGLAFMVIVYEILLYLANSCITRGSELFFKMYGTGYFGAIVFHLLGTIPQVGIVIVTGVTATAETAEAMATMNIGLVAGSAIMLLTLVWGSVVLIGSDGITGNVTTDARTSCTARIMMVSLIPFLILQVAKVLNSTSGIRIVILISLLVSFAFLVAYCIYQVFQPWIQRRRLVFLMRKYVKRTLPLSFYTGSGHPNLSNTPQVFTRIDRNQNQRIAALNPLILGIQIGGEGLESDHVQRAMEDFDMSHDSPISEQEFVDGISNWISARPPVNGQGQGQGYGRPNPEEGLEWNNQELRRARLPINLTDISYWKNQIWAACLLILGICIMILLANPLMETIQDLSTAASIPSFFTSYFLMPFAIYGGLAWQIITSARDKPEDAISLALSEIYNSVFMNNVMGLTIFLALVYIRNLSWDVSAAVLVVLIICSVMGLYASFSRKFPFWTCIIAYIMYPISLLMVYILTTFLGWT